MHDGYIALALIDQRLEGDLDLMPACLAPDEQSNTGLEVVADGGEVSHSGRLASNPAA